MPDSTFPRDFAGAHGSIDHLALLLVRDLQGEWRFADDPPEVRGWYRLIGSQWVRALPPKEACQKVIERVIVDVKELLHWLKQPMFTVDEIIERALEDRDFRL